MIYGVQWGKVILAGLCGAAIATVLVLFAAYLANEWNSVVAVNEVHVTAKVFPNSRHRILDIHYESSIAPQCPSWIQHTLYKDTVDQLGEKQRLVIPLLLTRNGLGAPASTTNFDIRFDLPDTVDSGAWYYTGLATTGCEWVPGFQRWRVEETPPVAVWVPPAK